MAGPEKVIAAVARNVRAHRTSRNWTVEMLATRAGVGKSMLVQIEQGRTNPSIATLCRLADGLGVALTGLVEVTEGPAFRIVKAPEAATLWRSVEGSSAKLMLESDPPSRVERWDWHIAVDDGYAADAHGLGTREHWFVGTGTLALAADGHVEHVHSGDAVLFSADRPHEYRNGGKDLLHFLMLATVEGIRTGETSAAHTDDEAHGT